MRKTKTPLLSTILMLIMCASIIVGSTTAYFTDNVTSTGNIIASASLKAGLQWAETLPADESGWQEGKDGTLFNDTHWEPNHTSVRYVKVTNKGNVAFQYELNVIPTAMQEGSANLMDVIDVYYGHVDANTPAITRENFATVLPKVGVLSDLITNDHGAGYGILLPANGSANATLPAGVTADTGSATGCLVLHMQQEAGNEYMNLTAGEGFKLQLAATQYTYENDAFGNTYDQAATLPILSVPIRVTRQVTPDAQGYLTQDVVFTSSTGVSAVVPAGAKVADGVTQLTLIVEPKAASEANLSLADDQIMQPYEVCIEGLAQDNLVPARISMGQVLPAGLNLGNHSLYHVEDGVTNAMTRVEVLADQHNTYTYEPATGDVSVAMATFSEVALVADEEAVWEGNFDYSWYTNAVATADTEAAADYVIANADQLAAFGAIVGGMNGQTKNSFSGKTVKLISDVNLGDAEDANNPDLIFYPIGYYNSTGKYEKVSDDSVTSSVSSFEGTFDGNGHTIKNFYQNTWEMFGDYNDGYSGTPNHYKDAMGLFGYVKGGTVKNLTVENFKSDGEFTPTGVIAAYAVNSTFENIAITNCNPRVYNTGNGGIVGIGGNDDDPDTYKLTFTNITIDNTNKISALWGSWDVACGGLVGMFRGDGHVYMTNCHVAAQMDVNNDVCGNYQYYWYRYSGMMVGTNKNMITDADGYTVPETDKFHAENCTVHFGEWNDYYYCELVANSLASYTHDHQFSRLEEVKAIKGTTITYLDGTTGSVPTSGRSNYVVVNGGAATENATCYHFVNGELWKHEDAGQETVDGREVLKEDKQHIYLPFNQLFTGYGWGVKHIPVYNGDDYAFDGIEILDRPVASSKEKFTKVEAAKDSYTSGSSVTIGELFEAAPIDDEKLSIKGDKVQVFVSPVGDSSNAGGTYVANTTDWTQGTLTFTGKGTASITITDYYYCTPTTITVTVEGTDTYSIKFPNHEKYLYRVGNQNDVSISSLFLKNHEEIEDYSSIELVVENADESIDVSVEYSAGYLKFTSEKTGPIKVTISDDSSKPVTLYLEVVDAKNTTTASFSGNTVLLNDVYTSSTLSANGVVYGNGFTVNMENAPISEKNGAVFHLYDGAVLKNLGIVGKEFTNVAMNVNDTNYGVSAVRAWGTVTIENCYISGCRSAVSVTGTELTIKDSVIANGVYANVDFRSGILNLHNVTTINEPHTVNGTTIVGLGIVGNMTASAGRQLNVTGTLTQYNWVSQADCSKIKASGVDSIYNSVFTEDKYASLRYTYKGTTYVNAGILSLCSDFVANAVTGVPSNYGGMDVTATISSVEVDGYVWAPNQAGMLTDDDMEYHDKVYEWTASDQSTSYIPGAFDYTNAGLTEENGVVQIEYESGSSYTLRADTVKKLLDTEKYGQTLSYKVSMNGTDYTDKDIVFDAAASNTYTITYTVTDNLVYDKNGTLSETTTYEVTKDLKVFATVVDKGADAPTFTFYYGTNGSASAGTPHTTQPTNSYTSTITQVGEAYYIMPNVSATTANAIDSQTVDGVTVYYPIVDGINVRSGSSTDYDFTRYYPVFKAVKISDNGTEYSYSGTKEMPATVAWVSATIDSGNGASALNDGFGLYNNQYLCKIQKKAGNAESGGTSVVKYSYTALDGNTYYYYVGYRFYDEDEGGVCVAPDTLVTLADGSKKEIQHVTYEDQLLVWNFYKGEYAAVPSAILFNHGEDDYNIVHLTFEDGTVVKVIAEHRFLDADSHEFVSINEYNAASYVGNSFYKRDGENVKTVKLVNAEVKKEHSVAYSLISALHYNFFVEDLFSSPFLSKDVGAFEYFDIDKNELKYTNVEEDIAEYGLYTYEEDFAEYITRKQFDAFNAQYMKIAVGKGDFTFEEIIRMINEYLAEAK